MEYGELTNEEQIIFDIFNQLIHEIGRAYDFIFFDKYAGGLGEICIYKDTNNKWILYVTERGQKYGYREYDNLYNLCLDVFEMLEKKHTDYCVSVFPGSVQNALNNQNNKIK